MFINHGRTTTFALDAHFAFLFIVVTASRTRTGASAGTATQICTLLLAFIFFGYLATLLRGGWHATVWIVSFGPIDTIFMATGGILIIGGIYAWRMMHEDVA